MQNKNIHTILIANRGEIALRIIRTIHRMGKKAVCIYSDADRYLPFILQADAAYPIGDGSLNETYLNTDLIIETAKQAGADAIHPGYGFLSENAGFAQKCRDAGIIFIGPSPEVIDGMGNKANARTTAGEMGVPILKGITGTANRLLEQKKSISYPVLVKPAAGGGGKAMRIVHSEDMLEEAVKGSEREALSYFGSGELYLEHYIEHARHIEVQILADHHGNTIHLFERECSVQRRYQKIIEESPSPSISGSTREKITSAAVKLAAGISYTNAGTIEFLLDTNENFYFIEMNTRIQVEHPVTEMITGIDLVAEQIRIAEGSVLSKKQEDVRMEGHAIEARIYAEDPEQGFMPSTGLIWDLDYPENMARIDSGFVKDNEVSAFYDPMIAKIIAHDKNRDSAARRLSDAIRNFRIAGIETNRSFLSSLLNSKLFGENRVFTRTIDQEADTILNEVSIEKKNIPQNHILALFALTALTANAKKSGTGSIFNELGYWRQVPGMKITVNNEEKLIRFVKNQPAAKLGLFLGEKLVEIEEISHSAGNYRVRIDNNVLNFRGLVNGSDIYLDLCGFNFSARRLDIPDPRYAGKDKKKTEADNPKEIHAPLNGKIIRINARAGLKVNAGDVLVVIESMKMENRITCPSSGEIDDVLIKEGELVERNKLLITLK